MIRNRKAMIRMMSRVMNRPWGSMLVFVLLGLAVSCAVYGIWPTVYEAKSVFAMDTCPPRCKYEETYYEMEYYSDDYGEIFEGQRSDWRSKEFFSRIICQFRSNYPDTFVSDKALGEMLENSKLERMGHSRRIMLTVHSPTGELAATLANIYVATIKSFIDEKNKERCEKALKQIHQQVERAKNLSNEIYQDLLQKEEAHRISVEQNNASVFVLRAAQVPTRPVAPNPRVIFPVGAVLSLVLGLLFCRIIQRRGSVSKRLGGAK